jgi:AcrR family transcriptional regulator
MTVRASTEKRLLDAADELLFTRGVAATPVDAVLERAGVSPATLYRAYGSKDGLVAAALQRRHREWLAVWDDAVAAAPDARGRLLAVFDALETFRARPDGARWCAFLGTAAEYADPPEPVAEAVRQDTESLRQRLGDLAAPVAGDEADALVEVLLVLVSGQLAMRLRTGDGPSDVARTAAGTLIDQAVREADPEGAREAGLNRR